MLSDVDRKTESALARDVTYQELRAEYTKCQVLCQSISREIARGNYDNDLLRSMHYYMDRELDCWREILAIERGTHDRVFKQESDGIIARLDAECRRQGIVVRK